MKTMYFLPTEIHTMILHKLPIKDIMSMDLVDMWKHLLVRDYNLETCDPSYKNTYIFSYLDFCTIRLVNKILEKMLDRPQNWTGAFHFILDSETFDHIDLLMQFHKEKASNFYILLSDLPNMVPEKYRVSVESHMTAIDGYFHSLYYDYIRRSLNLDHMENARTLMNSLIGTRRIREIIKILLDPADTTPWTMDYCVDIVKNKKHPIQLRYRIVKIVMTVCESDRERIKPMVRLNIDYFKGYLTPKEISQIMSD